MLLLLLLLLLLRLPAVEGAPGVESGVEQVAGDAEDIADDVLAAVVLGRRGDVPRLLLAVRLRLRDESEELGHGI